MHLMIFYGFLDLFIATTLLAINTYSPVKFHKGLYYLIYEMSADLMGLLFVFGVTWAILRRIKFIPKSMTNSFQDFWALGVLWINGITGFWVEVSRMSNQPKPFDWSALIGCWASRFIGHTSDSMYRFVWWFHVFWVIVFFITLPRMRLRHILLAIFSAAGKPEQKLGELKPVTLEQVEKTGQIGAAFARDYSRWHLLSVDACMECGRCTDVCPAYGVGKVLNPKLVALDIKSAMESGQSIAPAVSEEALWACTTCNACVDVCPATIRHVDMIVDVRRNLVSEGQLSGTAATMLRQTASTGNSWGASSSVREDWMRAREIPLAREKEDFEVLFWVGCTGATDPGAIKTTQSVAELFNKAGVDYACLGKEETCTGDAARRVGDEFLFQEMAKSNVETFSKYKVKKIVTPCPHCFNTLKNEYYKMDGKYEVWHHSRYFLKLVQEGKLKTEEPEKGSMTYHDPCYLSRINDESDAPRALLGEQTELNGDQAPIIKWVEQESIKESRIVEPEHYGKKTLCCGAGGGRMWMEEPVNKRPGNKRAKELLDIGASTIALGCPFCRIMLEATVKQITDQPIKLLDLAEMLQEANK